MDEVADFFNGQIRVNREQITLEEAEQLLKELPGVIRQAKRHKIAQMEEEVKESQRMIDILKGEVGD